MVEAYLKCKYWQNKQMPLYHHIKFKRYDRKNIGWHLIEDNEQINNQDLVKKTCYKRKEGLARVLVYDVNHREKVLVGIQNAINNLIYKYYVPRTNVIFHIPEEKIIKKKIQIR